MSPAVRWFALAVLLLAAPRAFGLATEHFGNAPVPAGWGVPAALVPLLNADSRVYWYEVNGDATFFYRGGSTPAANDALRKFAAAGKGLDVYLLPGPREVHSLTRTKYFVCDMELRVPGGLGAAFAAREADPDAVAAALVEVLKKEKHEYVRRCIAGSLQRLGKSATPALPLLEEGLNDPDKNVQAAYKSAVEAIKAAPEDKGQAEKVKKAAAVRADVGRFLKALPARKK